MTAKKVITDTMDSKEIVALLKEDNSFAQHKFDETYIMGTYPLIHLRHQGGECPRLCRLHRQPQEYPHPPVLGIPSHPLNQPH